MAWFSNDLKSIMTKIKEAQVLIEQAKNELDSLGDAAEEKVDNTPDNLQSGDRYDRAVERKETFQDQFGELDSVYDSLEEIKTELENID